MGSDEKKYSLDELPDEGSSSMGTTEGRVEKTSARSLQRPTGSPVTSGPRREMVSKASGDTRIRVMEQSWRFDKKEFLFGWVAYVLFVFAAQYLANSPVFRQEWGRLEETLEGLGPVSLIFKNPLIFIFLTPFIFSFKKESGAHFEIMFDGISTVKKIHLGPREFPTRLLVKWDEIVHVTKTNVNDQDILVLSSKEDRLAEMIWNISLEEKKGIQHMLKSFVTPAHPLRNFLEKDLA
jgi:hypothetical protein